MHPYANVASIWKYQAGFGPKKLNLEITKSQHIEFLRKSKFWAKTIQNIHFSSKPNNFRGNLHQEVEFPSKSINLNQSIVFFNYTKITYRAAHIYVNFNEKNVKLFRVLNMLYNCYKTVISFYKFAIKSWRSVAPILAIVASICTCCIRMPWKACCPFGCKHHMAPPDRADHFGTKA